jgi:predicted nuclease with TOPRIM domain
MADISRELHELVEDLKTHRDELRVRLHLAKAEVRDEWERLEREWEHLRGRMEAMGREAGRTSEDVAAALHLAADDLRKGYQRVRALL